MEREIETKFDVPLELPQEDILKALLDAALTTRCLFAMQYPIERTIQYFDTRGLDVYRQGNTVRRVAGFESTRNGLFRYDFKVGPLDDRYEANHWSDDFLTAREIVDRFNLQRFYPELLDSAVARTGHEKVKLEWGSTMIEASIDFFDVKGGGGKFRELELELEKGDTELLHDLSARVQEALDLKPMTIQKYSRVIQSLPEYKGRI